MPILQFNGKEYQIPYDPQRIAEMIYNGHKIYPDNDASQSVRDQHDAEIGQYLRKMWGDKQFKNTPIYRDAHPDTPKSAPDTGLETPQAGMTAPPGYQQDVISRGIQPSPFIKYQMPQIERPIRPLLRFTQTGGTSGDSGSPQDNEAGSDPNEAQSNTGISPAALFAWLKELMGLT